MIDLTKQRRFPLRDLLSFTTGKLLTEPKGGGNGIGALCEVSEHVLGYDVGMIGLAYTADGVARAILEEHPELRIPTREVAQIRAGSSAAEIDTWLERVRESHNLQLTYTLNPNKKPK